MNDDDLPSPPVPSHPVAKLSMEDLLLEVDSLLLLCVRGDGTVASEAYVCLGPVQQQALKQVSSLLSLMLPKKAELAKLLSGK